MTIRSGLRATAIPWLIRPAVCSGIWSSSSLFPSDWQNPGSRAILFAPSLADAGKVVNSQGEDILRKYGIFDKPVAVRCRDTFSRAVAFEEREGKEVYLDLRFLTASTWPGDHMA